MATSATAGLLDFFSRGVDYEKLRPAVEASLVPPATFFQKYTQDRTVFFGTTIAQAVQIPLKGLPMGDRPNYGPGRHTTTNYKDSVQAAHSRMIGTGIVIELTFIKEPRILHVGERLANDPQFKRLEEKLKNSNAVLSDLAEHFRLDGMVSTDTVIMIFNSKAVNTPQSLADLARPLIRRAQYEDVPYYRSDEVSQAAYEKIYRIAGQEAIEHWASPSEVQTKVFNRLFKDPNKERTDCQKLTES